MFRLFNRREAIAALAATAVLPLMPGCNRTPATASAPAATPGRGDAEALKVLDEIAENYLRFAPESATSLGIDTGARAALRSELSDRSIDGQKKIADRVRSDLDRAKAIDADRKSVV